MPFSFPMHEGETWKGSLSVLSDSSWLHGLQPTRFLCPWELSGKSTGVGCHCLLHLTLWLILRGYKTLAFASDRDQPAEQRAGLEALLMNSCMTCACILHSPITLDRGTVQVTLAWSIACAFLQGTRKQGPLGSADLENLFLSVHLSRSFLVNVVPLSLA